MKENYLDKIKYEKIGETKDSKERQLNWNIAFGLQAVDNLTPSKYMVDLATENIVGKKSYEVVEEQVRKYYENADNKKIDKNERQADEVSVKNEIFKDNSLYFRNALVRANYSNISNGIEEDNKYLIMFFENLLFNKNNKLDNAELKLSNKS